MPNCAVKTMCTFCGQPTVDCALETHCAGPDSLGDCPPLDTPPIDESPRCCVVCLQPAGLWSSDFCSSCLFASGYEPTRERRDLVFRALWDAIWEEIQPELRLPFPLDVPPKRPFSFSRGTSLFERVKIGVDLAEFASKFTDLRRAGPGKQKGRCPLHDERTPSFYIYEEKRTWRCYGACATGGDVILLAQSRFKLATPKDAAHQLAQEYGIPYPARQIHRPRHISVGISG